GEPQGLRLRLQARALGAVAHQVQAPVVALRGERLAGLQQDVDALDRKQVADEQQVAPAVVETDAAPGRVAVARVEQAAVDAVEDGRDPVRLGAQRDHARGQVGRYR